MLVTTHLDIVPFPFPTNAQPCCPSGFMGLLIDVPLETIEKELQSGATRFIALGPSCMMQVMASLKTVPNRG